MSGRPDLLQLFYISTITIFILFLGVCWSLPAFLLHAIMLREMCDVSYDSLLTY